MKQQSKVLIIYTGGTIGMIKDPETGALIAFDFEHLSDQIPELGRIDVALKAVSLKNPIDSSDMNPEIWREIARQIADNYNDFDGFVILHGSDTMAYTSSALSFMLQGLQKPVILTGSQLPIGTIRTDGKENFITSIEIAAAKEKNGQSKIREVAVYFEDYLYRGNRTTKVSANAFEAFLSPNYEMLAKAGIEIRYNETALYRTEKEEMTLHLEMDNKVALMKIFPGSPITVYQSFFDVEQVKAVVLETYGAGNIPNNPTLLEMMEKYIQRGGIILNITQCSSGSVTQGMYANSMGLNEIGVISGKDLTTEAAITKMMHLLGSCKNRKEIKEKLRLSIAGEMSIDL